MVLGLGGRRGIDRAAQLDMAKVHREIAQEREKERESQAALFARRVCPTARR